MQPEYNMENNELQKKSDIVAGVGETLLSSGQMNDQERMWPDPLCELQCLFPWLLHPHGTSVLERSPHFQKMLNRHQRHGNSEMVFLQVFFTNRC